MNSDQEKQLVEAVLDSNKKAFEVLVRQYERLILHIIFPLVKSNEDRKDLLQDVLIKIYQNLGTFRFKSKLSTWIGNVAYNATINYVKKKKLPLASTENLNQFEDWGIELLNPEQEFIAQELEAKVARAMGKLPPIQQMILRLFHHDEMTLDEICQVTNLPVNTVKSHLFRGRLVIRNLILQ